jgi:hypothetical protein
MSKAQDVLDAAKALCVEGESEEDHAQHSAKLEAAYKAFSDGSVSNPSPQGETGIDAHVVVSAEAGV